MKNDGERHEDTLATAFKEETSNENELIAAMTTPTQESNYKVEHVEFPDFVFWSVSLKGNWRYVFNCEDENSANKLVAYLDEKDKQMIGLEEQVEYWRMKYAKT